MIHTTTSVAGRLAVALLFFSAQLVAQDSRSPDSDWAWLTGLTAPPARKVPGQRKTREEHATEHARQVAQARQVVAAAKDFVSRHPGDARVAQARKLEAIWALRGVTASDPAQEAAAVAIAKTFRDDPTLPKVDRFHVAVAMDSQSLALRQRTGLVTHRAAEQKKLVEGWRSEFGDMPEIEAYAITAARRADPKSATEMAAQVLRSPVAAANQKKEATFIRERARLLGKELNLKLPLVDGGELDLKGPRSHVTVLVVWSPSKPESLQPLSDFRRTLPRGAQLVCLALGGTQGDVMRVRQSLPAVKHFAHAPLGASANQAAAALKLQLVPYVYVLNRAGALTDFGPLNELPALLMRAGVAKAKTS